MIRFKKSPVVFDEESHRYELEGKQLVGITGLIHQILGLGVYPDADDHVKDFVIPRAGSRGTAVHHAIQTYDQLGIRQTTQIVHTRYGCRERDNLRHVDETWNVTAELDAYIRHLDFGDFSPLANELTVSDNVKYASQIDNVWQNGKTGGIWLVDTKTNNIKLYPRCGYFNPNYFRNGEDALKEYLSWQLSIYAELFEMENPGLKVEGLACNWLKPDVSAFWIIDRKPPELVKELLGSEYIFTDDGPIFFHPDQSVFGISKNVPQSIEVSDIVPTEVVSYFGQLIKTYQDVSTKIEEAKKALRAAMEQHCVKSFDFGTFSATIGADSMTNSFDTKAFKADYPELYNKYTISKARKGCLTIKSKDKC